MAILEPSLPVLSGMVAGIAALSWLGSRAVWRGVTRGVVRTLNGLANRLEEQARALSVTERKESD